MKQQIYNLEDFATKYHLQDIFGAYAAYFTINRKDNENENDADFKVSDTAEDSFNNMVKERTLFTKLLLVKSKSVLIIAAVAAETGLPVIPNEAAMVATLNGRSGRIF